MHLLPADDPALHPDILLGPVRPDLIRAEVLVDLLETTAARVPDHMALIFGEQQLTYRELDAKASQAASNLIEAGVRPGQIVGLWLPRGIDLLVMQAAIAKTGAAWLPFDADVPVERIGICLADAKAVGATIREALPTAPEIVLHDSVRRAPEDLRLLIRRAGAENDVEAVYHDGEIHVFPGNIASIERMQFVVAHHEIRHHGLRSMLGPAMGPAMLRMYASNPNLKAAADAKMAEGLADTRVLAVEEALADMPMEELAKLNGWDKIVTAIRQWLRNVAAKLRRAGMNTLADAMEPGDIIIDGGNALYTDTIRREKAMADRGLHFVGAGISGGEEGALNGPSIMPGGPKESYESLGPLLEEISAHVDGVPCCAHIGPDGAGHFVKMVHNGIEYSDMQLIGEAYQLLRDGLNLSAPEIADVFTEWNAGDLDSFLVEITAEVLRELAAPGNTLVLTGRSAMPAAEPPALAALAGMIAAPLSSVYPGMGGSVLIICFVVVVIGGIGSIRGALLAALLIGAVDTFGKVLVPQAAGVLVYVLMALILLWKPDGLFKAG